MAWVFSLSAECGTKQSEAQQFAQYFNEISWMLSNGRHSQCRTESFQDIEENWWCRVCPSGISEIGIDTPESAYLMTEVGIFLYQSLRFAPPFRYALVGMEVDEFRTYSELIEEPALVFPGLVLAEAVWQATGASSVFQSFSLGYVWKPYEGEVYRPLLASPDLKNKPDELLRGVNPFNKGITPHSKDKTVRYLREKRSPFTYRNHSPIFPEKAIPLHLSKSKN
ncbi:hypothetical protein QUA74_03475 [Microcoleus sp. LAD1_D3]|uniref:hypothetical protein n=1 Tax=Microcoleus sp. LAD1_D3 TaxID=2819365 RepID=UPI002FD5FA9C